MLPRSRSNSNSGGVTKTPDEENFFARTKEENLAILQKYNITQQNLGQGAYSNVYKGMLKSDPQVVVAVKIIKILLKPGFNEKLRREMTILMKFDHQNIVKLYDVVMLDDKVFLFLEFCSGGDLNNKISSMGGILSEEEVLPIFKQICEAMRQLFSNNIIHRDLKPANILVQDDIVKLTDFGFAREVFTDMNEASEFTRLGTPIYMSPQILNGIPFSSKTDIWSLGILIYEMLYGKTPWMGKTPQDLLKNIFKVTLKFHDPQMAINSYASPLVKKKFTPVSAEMKDLLQKMLCITEEKRISWEDVFEHDVFKQKSKPPVPIEAINEEKKEKEVMSNSVHEKVENPPEVKRNGSNHDLPLKEIKLEKKLKPKVMYSKPQSDSKKKGFLSMFCC